MSITNTFTLSNEPARFTPNDLDALLIHCQQCRASDITFQTNEHVWANVAGKLVSITRRRLSHPEVIALLHYIYGPNGNAQILGGQDINTHYECRSSRILRYRFRINVTGCLVEGHAGIQISCRLIASTPPKLEDLHLEPGLRESLMPDQGVVYVAGPTGAGKSTLLASIIREIAENTESHRKILTYESPIEFTYDDIQKPHAIISQTEIPRHLPSFLAGVSNALRRHPQLILIGEALDANTLQAVIKAGLTGHPVYTTLHSNGVVETIRRLVHSASYQDNSSALIDALETIRVIVWQRLFLTADGKQIPLREFLVFNAAIRRILLDGSFEKITTTTRDLLHEYGQPVTADIARKFKAGCLTKTQYQHLLKHT